MFLKKLSTTLTLITFFSIASVNAADIIYKWKDKSGNIKYTETRPPAGVSYKMIKNRVSTSSKKAAATSAGVKNTGASADSLDERIAAQNSEKQRVDNLNAELNRKNCTISKNNLETLKNNQRIKIKDENGEERFLSSEEIDQRLETAKANVKKYCQ